MSKVCLIDGSGYIFRAFYALPTMTAPDGTPVNAVYGFVTMFMRLLKNINCDYCVVLFDAKRQNFRNEIFAEYKATRPEIPELLKPQFDLIHEAVEVMNIPYVLQEGYEADDLIATYAKQATEAGMEAVVVSADKDLMQLIKDGVQYYDGMKDKFFNPEDVKEKFGVYPDKVIDVQALSGDKIDNIPGVAGIGPKTAAELVNAYGSLEGVLQNLSQIKQEKRRQLLTEHQDDARISLKLVTLNDKVPVEHLLSEFKCQAPQMDTVLAFADRLGFKSIRPKLEKWVTERCATLGGAEVAQKIAAPKVATKYVSIENEAQLTALAQKIETAQKVAFQVLHNGREVCGISLSTVAHEGYYLPIGQTAGDDLFAFAETPKTALPRQQVLDFLQNVLSNGDILKIGVAIKPQWHWLNALFGQQLDLFAYDDVGVMSYVLDSSAHGHSLSVLSEMFLDETLAEPKISAKNPLIDFTAEEYGDFRFAAADYALRLHGILKRRLVEERRVYVYEMIERRLTQVLMQMEEAGILVNQAKLTELDEAFKLQMGLLEQEAYALAGKEFNLASPKQIGEILFAEAGLKGKKTATGAYNTGAAVLEKLADDGNELAAKILEWRSYAKLQSTYTTALLAARDGAGRVHTTFAQTVVNTGRLASSNPNLQNIPNRTGIGQKIRECFVAREGYKIVAADYSQMELRLLAAVADVKALKEAFAAGVDIHAATAARVFGLKPDEVDKEHRRRAKAINFGIVYGISQFGLARQLGIAREEAKQYIDSYFKIMPEVQDYMAKTIEFAHQNGYVETPLGRKCAVLGINDKNRNMAAFAERAAINAPIQGGAADIVKLAMQRVVWALKEQNLAAELLLQVHDELVLEVRDDAVEAVKKLLKDIMENVIETAVPMIVDVGVGQNWHEAH